MKMLDLLFIGAITGFFLATLAYVAGCEKLRGKEMNLESIIGLLAAVLLMIYLGYALLRPEKF